jgi:hypothetical protein
MPTSSGKNTTREVEDIRRKKPLYKAYEGGHVVSILSLNVSQDFRSRSLAKMKNITQPTV